MIDKLIAFTVIETLLVVSFMAALFCSAHCLGRTLEIITNKKGKVNYTYLVIFWVIFFILNRIAIWVK